MNFRQEHPVVFTIGSVACVCVAVVASIFTIGNYSVQAAKIKAETDLQKSIVHEREETERTEERAHFWQQLIPWGSYEGEESKK